MVGPRLHAGGVLRRLDPRHWGISVRSAAVSAVVVLMALGVAGLGLTAILYRSLINGVDDIAVGRVRDIVDALHSDPVNDIDSGLFATDERVVAVQLVAPDGVVVQKSASAPNYPLIPISDIGTSMHRGFPDDAVRGDNMRVSGITTTTSTGTYTVIVGGASESAEATAQTVALLLLGAAPVVTAVAAAASYWLVRRSLRSVDAIRSRVAEISTSDLSERVPLPSSRDEISALAVTMNEMLGRIEAGHRAQRQFVGDASHELRSPLATIVSGFEVVDAHPELLDAELIRATLMPEAQRMRALIDDLLLLARADERDLVLRRESAALDRIAEEEAVRARRDAEVTIRADIEAAQVIGDPLAISRVVRNLLENAVRHAKSEVVITTGAVGGTATLAISDDGPGIAPSQRARAFGRFVRLDEDRARSGGGTGLGLAIVAEIVAAHDGTITVDDRTGGGTVIEVTFPQHSSR